MAVNGEVERMTSSDLDLTSQTETEDTDTGDLEESGTTFTSSEATESSFASISSSTSNPSKYGQSVEMRSVSSADGSTSTGDTEQSDTDKSGSIFKYPPPPKASYDFTEVSELSNFENLSNYERRFSVVSNKDEFKKECAEKTHPFPDFTSMKGDWYTHPCFKRYWDHYQTVMGWCGKHYQVYNSMVMADHVSSSMYRPAPENRQISNMLAWQQYYRNSYHTGATGNNGNRNMERRSRSSMNRKRIAKKRKRRRLARSRSSKGEGHESGEDDEKFEMEITDGMLEFFKQSEEHRRLRDEEKKASNEAGKEEEHINIEEVKVTAHKGPTTAAPKDRPGAKRTSEMKLLYGKGAAMIHGMETALQMTFDRNLDVKEPKLWPNMPLKLVFG